MLPERVKKIDLAQELGLSLKTIDRYVKVGRLPRPERPAYHRSEWRRETLEPLLESLRPNR